MTMSVVTVEHERADGTEEDMTYTCDTLITPREIANALNYLPQGAIITNIEINTK